MTAVKPSRAYRVTFFQTFSTDPQVVSTSVQPSPWSRASSCRVTPKAGMMTTSPAPSGGTGAVRVAEEADAGASGASG